MVKHKGCFHKSTASKDGLQNYCVRCKRIYDRPNKLKRIYGLTMQEFNDMLEEQDNKCAICGKQHLAVATLCVDHNHETGHVRGLLCNQCNTSLGLLKDNISFLAGAIIYLNERDNDGFKC